MGPAVDALPPLTVPSRFSGPPGSANGGWVSGALASRVLGAAEDGIGKSATVTLRQPPPLGTRMQVAPRAEGGIVMRFGGIIIAEVEPAPLEVDAVDPVGFERAAAAMVDYAGYLEHPFPTCFSCGSSREAPDGLGLRPGLVGERPATTATTWIPDASVATYGAHVVDPEAVWSALDCPGGWTVDLAGRPMVLGRMTAQVDVLPAPGDRCVVMGALLRREGRKTFTATTLYDDDDRVLARAAAVWIEIDPATIRR
jgi:hypothetical protein